MLYDITLRIEYDYQYPADSSRHVVRIMPMDLPGEQRLIAGSHRFEPAPDEHESFFDFFGNRAMTLAYFRRHEDIAFNIVSRVERLTASQRFDTSPALETLGNEIGSQATLAPWSPHHFLHPTGKAPLEAETSEFARDASAGANSVLGCVVAIGKALHRDMRFDAKATTVDTPMIEAFRARHGVCQDFTHIMISCLRGLGIPAGYVSGFLRTIPPPDKPRLEGADAMHAWVRAWCGSDMGWVEYDPTNKLFAGVDHVVVARGRDYADVAPVKGIMRSYGGHKTKQRVDVAPVGALAEG